MVFLGLVRRKKLIRSLSTVRVLSRLEALRGGNPYWGAGAVWRWSYGFPPPYIRESREAVPRGFELVKTEAEYFSQGGDCDDDVAALMRRGAAWSVVVVPELVGNPARHIRSVVGSVRIDRVPGAPRWSDAN